MDLGRCLIMSFVVNPGHNEKLFFAIAAVKVDTGSNKHTVCRYCARSCFDYFCLIIILTLLLVISSWCNIGKSALLITCLIDFSLCSFFLSFFRGTITGDLLLDGYIPEWVGSIMKLSGLMLWTIGIFDRPSLGFLYPFSST